MLKRWLKRIYLLPFWVMMGIDGDDGSTVVDDSSGDDNQSNGSTDDGSDGNDNPNGDDQLDQGQDNSQQHQQPLIPRKAYESEKEKRQEEQRQRQRLEQENLELRQKLESAPQVPAKKPETVEEHFDVNPKETMAWLNQQILTAKAANDYDKVEELKDLKTNLLERSVLNTETRTSTESRLSKVNAEIYKILPDFDSKKAELVKLATELGYTEQDAKELIDPSVVGDVAARSVKFLSEVYAMRNAGKTARNKEVRTPTKVESAGNGGFSNNDSTRKQFNKAKESGHLDDWAALLG